VVTLEPDAAVLLGCCGSGAWARQVAAQGPYPDLAALLESGQRIWCQLSPADWREALSAHPRIGDQPEAGTQERREQSGVEHAPAAVLAALAEGNARYEQTFGMTYVVRAAGRSAEQLLELLRERLTNDPATELTAAAGQQWEITGLRLAQALGAP
jgi:OHCU decarboxylase